MNRHLLTLAFITCCLLISSVTSAAEQTFKGKIKSVDIVKNSITLDDLQLDVTRKTKITVDGKKSTLADIKSGQQANVIYDDGLDVAASIAVGKEAGTDDAPTEALNLEELNSSDSDSAPYLSSDGLQIFWTVGKRNGNSEDLSIWSARRKDADSLFADKKQLYSGHAPMLSADGLQLYFRSSDGEAIKSATRKSPNHDFGRSRPEPSLSFPGQDAAPRWLTEDGLTFYLDMKIKGGPHHTWEVNRSRVTDNWGMPRLVKAEFDGMPEKFRFTQVSGTDDNLHLYCVVDFPPKGIRIGILSRKKPSGPFTQWTEIPLMNAQGQYPLCLRPTFVPATSEFFLVSKQFFEDPATAEKRSTDIWVIKDFHPPIEK